MIKCKKHGVPLRKSVKDYCPICEGEFSAHGLNNIRTCPFMYDKKRNDPVDDLGRAYPLIKGSTGHYVADVFNKSLKYIPKNKYNKTLSIIFSDYQAFISYTKILLGNLIIESCEPEIYSFYLFKKELYESFKNANKLENMIPLIGEEWLSIPFDRKQFEQVLNNKKNAMKNWIKIGIHNIIDETILDVDNKAICIDYKTYPRKKERNIKEIRSTDKKYQLITALMTFEYHYNIEVKFVANVDLGAVGFPNISYHKPTGRGITYYKKALFQAYKYLLENNYPTKFNQRYCLNFCDYKFVCPDENLKRWRDFMYVNIL